MKAKPSNTRGILSFSAKFNLKSGPHMEHLPYSRAANEMDFYL